MTNAQGERGRAKRGAVCARKGGKDCGAKGSACWRGGKRAVDDSREISAASWVLCVRVVCIILARSRFVWARPRHGSGGGGQKSRAEKKSGGSGVVVREKGRGEQRRGARAPTARVGRTGRTTHWLSFLNLYIKQRRARKPPLKKQCGACAAAAKQHEKAEAPQLQHATTDGNTRRRRSSYSHAVLLLAVASSGVGTCRDKIDQP